MAKSQVSDALLVEMYVSGNESALATLINRHQARLYSFIYSKVSDRDLADDFFQDTFIKVVNTLKSGNYYNEKGKFLPWVMRISSNLIVDYYRKNKKMKMHRDTDEFSIFSIIKDSEPGIEASIIVDQINFDLKKIIEELPEDQKQVLKLRYYNDMSFKEIAECTGTSLNTCLGRMRYAIQNMRKIIEKNQISLTA